MNDVRKMGRVTIPTDTDAVSETLNLLKRWGADAIRDCDGTEFPQELKDTGAKIYATYYTTRKDNAWAKANPDETQQCYIMTPFYTQNVEGIAFGFARMHYQGLVEHLRCFNMPHEALFLPRQVALAPVVVKPRFSDGKNARIAAY